MRTPTERDLVVMTIALAVVTSLVTFARLAIRKFVRGRLQIDDYCNIIAYVLLITVTGLVLDVLPLSHLVQEGTVNEAQIKKILLYGILGNIFARIVLFACQATFLALYWNLFAVSKQFRRAWILVAAYVTVCFLANFMVIFWICGKPSALRHIERCQPSGSYSTRALVMTCVLNVTSDLAILCLPMGVLHILKMKRSQKIGLAAIFALGTLVIVFDILRTVYSLQESTKDNALITMVWSISEPYVAAIAAAMPTLYTLVNFRSKTTTRYVYEDLERSSIARTVASPLVASGVWRSRSDAESSIDQHVEPSKRDDLELRQMQKYRST